MQKLLKFIKIHSLTLWDSNVQIGKAQRLARKRAQGGDRGHVFFSKWKGGYPKWSWKGPGFKKMFFPFFALKLCLGSISSILAYSQDQFYDHWRILSIHAVTTWAVAHQLMWLCCSRNQKLHWRPKQAKGFLLWWHSEALRRNMVSPIHKNMSCLTFLDDQWSWLLAENYIAFTTRTWACNVMSKKLSNRCCPGLLSGHPILYTDTVDAAATRHCMTGGRVEPSDNRSFRIHRGRSAAAADSAEFKRLR